MKKKNIIIVLIALLCICAGIGAFQAAGTENDKTGTTVISSESNKITSDTATVGTTKAKVSKSTAASASASKTITTYRSSSNTETTAAAASTTKKAEASENNTSEKSTEKKSFKVSITISCKNAAAYGADVPEYILTARSITVNNGDTVFDALKSVCKANGISLKYQSIYYVQGIGGLNEKDCGEASGWMYRVNGNTPQKAAAGYTLSQGDKIEWYYVTSPSDK